VNGNGHGSARTTDEEDLAAYDASPAWLRREMRHGPSNWSAVHLLRDVIRLSEIVGEDSARDRVRRMMREDKAETCYRFYGPDHPEADAHGRTLRPAPNAVGWPDRRRK